MKTTPTPRIASVNLIVVTLGVSMLAAATLSPSVADARGAAASGAARGFAIAPVVPACAHAGIGRRGPVTAMMDGRRATIVDACPPSFARGASALRDALEAELDLSAALGLVAGVRQTRGLRVLAATGYSDLEQSRSLEIDDRFRVASITKPFTAIVVLQLVEERQAALDDPIDAYLPGLSDGGRVTLRQLLSHTSGIPDFVGDPAVLVRIDQAWDHDELIASEVARGLLFEPGSSYSYSNTNFIALGRIIERITGSTYAEELERRILRPLRLSNTSIDDASAPADDVVAGARVEAGDLVAMPVVAHPSLTWSAGGMISNADDLLRWIEALFDGRLLRRASLAAMTAPTVLTDGTESSYGLGIAMVDSPLGRAFYHDGNLAPYTSLIGYVPEARLGVVVLSSTREAPALSIYGSLTPTLVDAVR